MPGDKVYTDRYIHFIQQYHPEPVKSNVRYLNIATPLRMIPMFSGAWLRSVVPLFAKSIG